MSLTRTLFELGGLRSFATLVLALYAAPMGLLLMLLGLMGEQRLSRSCARARPAVRASRQLRPDGG